jgi:tetratricopeptide (TPR) repeat protein
MKVCKQYIIVILLAFQAIAHASVSNDTLWKSAEALYKKGSYKEAVDKYQLLNKSGYRSAALYFNLGNSFFKMKEYSTAVLYFEKARLLAPNDDEIKYNLELTRTLTGDKMDAIEEFFIYRWVRAVINLLPFEYWAWLSVSCFVLSLIMIALYLFARIRIIKVLSFWLAVALFFISLNSFVFASIQHKTIQQSNTAIIMTPAVTAKSSPSETGSDLFVVHDGTKISILQKSGDWAEIRLADGSRGWVKISDFEEI